MNSLPLTNAVFLLLSIGTLFLTGCQGTQESGSNAPSVEIEQKENGDNDLKDESNDTQIPEPQKDAKGDINDEIVKKDNKPEILSFEILPESHTYTQQKLSFSRTYNKADYPFVGGSLIDIDSDGIEEIFITGEGGVPDALFTWNNGSFENSIEQSGISNTQASYGSLALDIDKDEDSDLLVARNDGIYLYTNTYGVFDETKLNIDFPAETVPVDITPGDVDNDGDIDLYISTFIQPSSFKLVTFNDENHKKPNLLLINQGDGTFVNETESRGLTYSQNTFTAIFADLDNDGWQDLVVSPNTDTIKVFMNSDGLFTKTDDPTAYGFWMGMTANDLDGDGDIDLYASNSGTSVPNNLLKGDTQANQEVDPAFAYLSNDQGVLTQDIKNMSPSENGFGWAVVSTDLNGDTNPDLLIAQNNIKRPPHKLKKLPGEALIYQKPLSYDDQTKFLGLSNKEFGFGIMHGDVDGNGLEDIVYLNLNAPTSVALHTSENKNNNYRLQTPLDLSWYGKRIELEFPDKTIYSTYYLPKQGVLTSQSSSLLLPIGNQTKGIVRIIDSVNEKTVSEVAFTQE